MDRIETWKWPITDHKSKTIGQEDVLYVPNTEKNKENKTGLEAKIKAKTPGYRLVSYYYDRGGSLVGQAWVVPPSEPLLAEAVKPYQFPEWLH